MNDEGPKKQRAINPQRICVVLTDSGLARYWLAAIIEAAEDAITHPYAASKRSRLQGFDDYLLPLRAEVNDARKFFMILSLFSVVDLLPQLSDPLSN